MTGEIRPEVVVEVSVDSVAWVVVDSEAEEAAGGAAAHQEAGEPPTSLTVPMRQPALQKQDEICSK